MANFAPTCAVISFLHATSATINEEHRETLRKGTYTNDVNVPIYL